MRRSVWRRWTDTVSAPVKRDSSRHVWRNASVRSVAPPTIFEIARRAAAASLCQALSVMVGSPRSNQSRRTKRRYVFPGRSVKEFRGLLPSAASGGTTMKIHRLYADEKGQSHFQDVEIEFKEQSRAGRMSARLPASGIIFRQVAPDYDLDWHPAPRRQYIVNLDAGVQITASDGEARRIGAGEVILVEDTWGKGHLSKALDGKLRHCIFVTLD